MLASKCKKRQGRDFENEIIEAGNLFVKYSKLENSENVKGALLCASKCYLLLGEFDKAKDVFQKAKMIMATKIHVTRPIVTINDSKAVAMKLQSYIEKLSILKFIFLKMEKMQSRDAEKSIPKINSL